ncbi:MAG: hypothetical protein HYW16_04780 [Candidatus Rokubacteria bacterium]|nr:hypothetical protein [Candidatus Rokubacteria bacterium]
MAIETTEKYCPICGKPVTDPTWTRFAEWCCSEPHAEEYVKEVRAQRVQAAAAPGRSVAPEEQARPGWVGRRRGGC